MCMHTHVHAHTGIRACSHVCTHTNACTQVELFDRPSLRTCEDFEHLHFLRGLSDTATALLIECRGDSQEVLLSVCMYTCKYVYV